jgi:hypothetical protein
MGRSLEAWNLVVALNNLKSKVTNVKEAVAIGQ